MTDERPERERASDEAVERWLDDLGRQMRQVGIEPRKDENEIFTVTNVVKDLRAQLAKVERERDRWQEIAGSMTVTLCEYFEGYEGDEVAFAHSIVNEARAMARAAQTVCEAIAAERLWHWLNLSDAQREALQQLAVAVAARRAES